MPRRGEKRLEINSETNDIASDMNEMNPPGGVAQKRLSRVSQKTSNGTSNSVNLKNSEKKIKNVNSKNKKQALEESQNLEEINDGNVSKKSGLEEVKIKRIGVLSFALTLALINVFLGFILGLLSFILSFAFSSLVEGTPFTLFLGAPSLIIFPSFFGILAFIGGLIIALLYNLVAKLTKGFELYA